MVAGVIEETLLAPVIFFIFYCRDRIRNCALEELEYRQILLVSIFRKGVPYVL